MLLIMAATSSVAIADDNTWEFDSTTEPGTLVIKGKGDLTTADQSTDYDVFTSAAVGNVFTNNTGTSVNSQDAYDLYATYFYTELGFTQLFDGGAPTNGTYAYDVSTTTVWDEETINTNDTYIYKAYIQTWSPFKLVINSPRIISGSRDDSESMEYNKNTYTKYVKLSSAASEGDQFDPDESILLTEAQLANYLNSTTKYTAAYNSTLYRSQDNGATKQQLTAGQTYTYNVGDLFYTDNSSATYIQITDNATFFAANPSYLGVATETITFKQALLQEIQNNSYTKVVFDNTGSGALTIDPEIAQIILFPNSNANNTITELDLGEATTTSFEHLLANPAALLYMRADNLAKVTLPLVAAVNNEVVLPADVIPGVYNTTPANLKTITVPKGYTKIGEKALAVYNTVDGSGNNVGHGSTQITTVNLPSTLTEIGDEAFYGITNLTNINITDAEVAGRSIVLPSTVATIGKSAFEGCTSLTSTKDDPFILPSGLKKVKAWAFIDLQNLKYIQLNEGLVFVGNSAFGIDGEVHDQTTITFPKSIKYIGPGSFIGRWYQDIYFTGTSAPACPLGRPTYSGWSGWGNITAFSANTQMGNNGFNPYKTTGSTADDASNTGYANRENYVGSGGYYFTILHFPDGLPTDSAKTYRDITRRYVTALGSAENASDNTFHYGGNIAGIEDPATPGNTFGSAFEEDVTGSEGSRMSVLHYYMGGTSTTEGQLLDVYTHKENVQPGYIDTYLGEQQVWPSQSQWQRNFVTVANGVEWDGTMKYRPTVTKEMFDMMKEDGLMVKANSLDYTQSDAVRIPNSNDNSQGGHMFSLANKEYNNLPDSVSSYLSLILYQGTRRFVLSYDGGYDIPFVIPMQGGLWWSICLPFSLTKNEVDGIFGPGTHVCLMSAVDRTVTTDPNGKNTLVLKFKNDVYRHKTERTFSTRTITTGDKTTTTKVYTYASKFNKDSDGPGQDDVVIYARESYMIFPTKDNNDAAQRDFGSPVFETGNPLPTMVQVNRENGEFTEGFNQQYLINGSDPVYRFIGNFTSTVYTTANETTTAVTVKVPKYSYAYGKMGNLRKFFILDTDKAAWSPFKSIVQNTAVGGGAEDWNNFFQQNAARVNQVSLFGDDEEITGIDNVIIEVSSDNDEDLRVFNLNGSMMGNSLQGLPAGTYIQGGKAYRVK